MLLAPIAVVVGGVLVLGLAGATPVQGASEAARARAAGDPPSSPPDPEPAWTLELGLDAAGRYLFRGLELLDEEPVLVPRARFAAGPWAVAYYGYLGTMPAPSRAAYREHDLSVDYTFRRGRLALTAGALTYQFGASAERDLAFFDTYEVYAIARWDAALAPTISYYHDIDAVDGGYASLGLSHARDLVPGRLALTVAGAVGFDFGYNLDSEWAAEQGRDPSRGEPSDILLGADLAWRWPNGLVAHGQLQRSIALRALEAIGQDDTTVITWGVSYTVD